MERQSMLDYLAKIGHDVGCRQIEILTTAEVCGESLTTPHNAVSQAHPPTCFGCARTHGVFGIYPEHSPALRAAEEFFTVGERERDVFTH